MVQMEQKNVCQQNLFQVKHLYSKGNKKCSPTKFVPNRTKMLQWDIERGLVIIHHEWAAGHECFIDIEHE